MKKDDDRRWMRRLVRRCRDACRTNEPQSTAAAMLSVMMVAAAGRAGAEWWQCVIAGAFWPIIAFMANLASPIPPNDSSAGTGADGKPLERDRNG